MDIVLVSDAFGLMHLIIHPRTPQRREASTCTTHVILSLRNCELQVISASGSVMS